MLNEETLDFLRWATVNDVRVTISLSDSRFQAGCVNTMAVHSEQGSHVSSAAPYGTGATVDDALNRMVEDIKGKRLIINRWREVEIPAWNPPADLPHPLSSE